MGKLAEIFNNAKTWKHFHGWMTVIWIILIFPSMLWWAKAIPWIVFMSVWANVGTHFGAWQATRAEVESGENPPDLTTEAL